MGRHIRRRIAAGAATSLVAGLLSVLGIVGAPDASALPAVCATPSANVYVWTGAGGPDWTDPNNWNHPSTPGRRDYPTDDQDNDTWQYPADISDTDDTVACIGAAVGRRNVAITDAVDGFVWVRQLHVEGTFAVSMPDGNGLLVNGTGTLGSDVTVNVGSSTFGGNGTITTAGTINVTNGTGSSVLSSAKVTGPETSSYTGPKGTLVIANGGRLLMSQKGLASAYGYGIESSGLIRITGNSWIAANTGTRWELNGGLFDFKGDATGSPGFYQGFQGGYPSGVLATFVNAGLVRKSSGSGVSLVDADYSGSGDVEVLEGSLALPGQEPISAEVVPGQALRTGRCAVTGDQTSLCPVTAIPSVDPYSVYLQVPATGLSSLRPGSPARRAGSPVRVDLQEDPASADITASRVGPVMQAHMNARASASAPAYLRFRYARSELAGLARQDLAVWRVPDGSSTPVALPDCVTVGQVPAGQFGCVAASAANDTSTNLYFSVYTRFTSRWIMRKRLAMPISKPVLSMRNRAKRELRITPGSRWPKGVLFKPAFRIRGTGKVVVLHRTSDPLVWRFDTDDRGKTLVVRLTGRHQAYYAATISSSGYRIK